MDVFHQLIGNGDELTNIQMCVRAVIIFAVAYLLIRISGRRSFAQHSPLDNIIVILLGAILSRAVTGASPFLPVILACVVLVLLHRLMGWLMSKNAKIGGILEGRKILLYANGKFIDANLRRSLVCREDIWHAIRQDLHTDDLEIIDKIYMERNGKITMVRKTKKN